MSKWSCEIVENKIYKNYNKAIVNSKHEIIAIVDILQDDFINTIIKKHNNDIDNEYERGLKEGIKLYKNLNKIN